MSCVFRAIRETPDELVVVPLMSKEEEERYMAYMHGDPDAPKPEAPMEGHDSHEILPIGDHERSGPVNERREVWDDPDELASLMQAIQRHVLKAPAGAWDDDTLGSARTLNRGIAARLTAVAPNGGTGVCGEHER